MQKIAVICHEIGHIMLGHTFHNGILGSNELKEIEDGQEEEAEEFALELQAPIPILRQMDMSSVDEIDRRGILTRKDARKQLAHMRKRTLSKSKTFIIAIALAFMLCGSITWQLISAYQDSHNTLSIEPTTTYIRQIGNGNSAVDLNALSDEKKAQTVYVTHSGEKYHEPDCGYVKYKTNITELTLGEAVENGYDPCSVCDP